MSDVTFFEQVYARYAFFIDRFFRNFRKNNDAVKSAEFRKKWYLGVICGRRAYRSLRHALSLRHDQMVALIEGNREHAATLKVIQTTWEYEAELYFSLAMQLFETCVIDHELQVYELAVPHRAGGFATNVKLDGLASELESYGLNPAEIRERIVGQFDRS